MIINIVPPLRTVILSEYKADGEVFASFYEDRDISIMQCYSCQGTVSKEEESKQDVLDIIALPTFSKLPPITQEALQILATQRLHPYHKTTRLVLDSQRELLLALVYFLNIYYLEPGKFTASHYGWCVQQMVWRKLHPTGIETKDIAVLVTDIPNNYRVESFSLNLCLNFGQVSTKQTVLFEWSIEDINQLKELEFVPSLGYVYKEDERKNPYLKNRLSDYYELYKKSFTP